MKNLSEYAELCMMILDDCGIAYDDGVAIFANDRFTSLYGQARRRRGALHFEISINSALLEDTVADKALENTILHELLHTVEGCQNHGAKWKRLANLVNSRYGYDIQRCGGDKDENSGAVDALIESNRYVIRCKKCGDIVALRNRKCKLVNHPDWYLSNCCKSELEVIDTQAMDYALVANR